jgi:hypothetical protein
MPIAHTLPPLHFKGKETEIVPAEIVGLVDAQGHIKGTPYQYHTKQIRGGVAMTAHDEYLVKGDTLVDPLTGDVFKETKKKTGFFNAKKALFVKPYCTEEGDDK